MSSKTTEYHPKNRVLSPQYAPSKNFYRSDLALRHVLQYELSEDAHSYLAKALDYTGIQAATTMNPLSLTADKQGPTLIKRDFLGNTINRIEFHPAYDQLKAIAVHSSMFRVKWEPQLRQRFRAERHRAGFATGLLYAMSESGLYCPLCMTDGVARLIDRYASPADRERLLPHIYTNQPDQLYTGAMFLTEKAGGSDVGANLVSATHVEGEYYHLNGEKWFCSNANAELIFVLARTDAAIKGTKGLSIFLVEKNRPDGTPNPLEVVRLKDKLGVRSMASAECLLTDTWGKRIGAEQAGFKIMTDMINLSRLYNAVAATGGLRRALAEAYQYLQYRTAFGRPALTHALVRTKLRELGALHLANFYLTWRTIRALDRADNGDATEAQLLRLLTPMVKRSTAAACVYGTRESMELMGGMGYIEDGVLPKIMRDMLVLPIWEGAGNIMVLDMLRASLKSEGLTVMIAQIRAQFEYIDNTRHMQVVVAALGEVERILPQLKEAEPDVMQATALPVFERLTVLFQITCLLEYRDDTSKVWIDPALHYLYDTLMPAPLLPQEPPSLETIRQLMAWE